MRSVRPDKLGVRVIFMEKIEIYDAHDILWLP